MPPPVPRLRRDGLGKFQIIARLCPIAIHAGGQDHTGAQCLTLLGQATASFPIVWCRLIHQLKPDGIVAFLLASMATVTLSVPNSVAALLTSSAP